MTTFFEIAVFIVASNAAAVFPSPRVSREGTRGEGNTAAPLEAIFIVFEQQTNAL